MAGTWSTETGAYTAFYASLKDREIGPRTLKKKTLRVDRLRLGRSVHVPGGVAPAMAPPRTFLLVANRADPSGQAPLEDLAGAGGRFDLVARFVSSVLLTSHGIREDAQAVVWFDDGEDPVGLRVRGDEAVGIRPDERSTAARLNDALSKPPMPVWQEVAEGVQTRAVGLSELLAELPGPLAALAEDGRPVGEHEIEARSFVLGDQDDLTEEQRRIVDRRVAERLAIGPVPLQADQAVTVVHNLLDRREASFS